MEGHSVDAMKLSSISGITCYVADLDKTAMFYEKLGFRVGSLEDDRLTCYVNWFFVTFIAEDKETDPELREDAQLPNRGAGQSMYLKVEDIDDFYNGVRAKGMNPASEPQRKPSGNREFMLRDPDGYKLVFFAK